MTLFSYEIFDAVARQGSFNKAAQQLHLTPSAISHAIAVMEAELGFTLFNRGKNGVTMTSYGASLYPSIRAVLNSDEALQQSIARLNGLEKGKVKLGAFNSVCAGLLPQILKSFMASYPQIEVEVYQGTYDDVKEWLRTGQVDLAFLISERIDSVLVDEGDTVVPGQKLATLETVRLQQAVDEARQTTEAARQNYLRVKNGPRAEEIAQARSNVQAAEATLNNAAVRSKRLVALADTKSISRQEADDAVASQQVAAANLDVARKQLELLLAGSRVEDIAQSLAQYNQAKANLVIREQNLKDAVLYAPGNAVVRNRILEKGDMASPQKPVYNLSLNHTKWVRAYLTESQLGKVKPGFSATVHNDSFPDTDFKGTVGFISSVAEFTPKNVETPDLRTALVYEVRIIVDDPDNRLRLGAPATVTIPLDQAAGQRAPEQPRP